MYDQVHLAMVRYHEAGRFCEKGAPWDQDSAVYHLERAGMCGELEAIVALAQCYLQLPHHILSEIELEVLSLPFPKGGIITVSPSNFLPPIVCAAT